MTRGSDTDHDWLTDTRASYDTVAANYRDYVRGAFATARHLRAALGVFAENVAESGGGPVADVGCGTGNVTAHLHGLGCDVFGIDLSPGMVEMARQDHPGLRFEVGSMTDLPLGDGTVGGVLACWSLIHVPDEALPGVLAGFRRVLRPGAPVLVGFHAGEVSKLKTEGYGGLPMRVWIHKRTPERMAQWLREAGFVIDAQWLVDGDSPSPGAMLFAH